MEEQKPRPSQAVLAQDNNKTIIENLAQGCSDEERKAMVRDAFLVLSLKTTTDRGKYEPRKLTAQEAFAYVMATRDIGLNPLLDHVAMLEGKLYITLDGHQQNAHQSRALLSESTECVYSDTVKREFRFRCTIERKAADGSAMKFSAEGFASPTTIKRKDPNILFIEQMAEARAMRRCLKRAFPVGMPSFEDREIGEIEDHQPAQVTEIKENDSAYDSISSMFLDGKSTSESIRSAIIFNHENGSLTWQQAKEFQSMLAEKISNEKAVQETAKRHDKFEQDVTADEVKQEMNVEIEKAPKATIDVNESGEKELKESENDISGDIAKGEVVEVKAKEPSYWTPEKIKETVKLLNSPRALEGFKNEMDSLYEMGEISRSTHSIAFEVIDAKLESLKDQK